MYNHVGVTWEKGRAPVKLDEVTVGTKIRWGTGIHGDTNVAEVTHVISKTADMVRFTASYHTTNGALSKLGGLWTTTLTTDRLELEQGQNPLALHLQPPDPFNTATA